MVEHLVDLAGDAAIQKEEKSMGKGELSMLRE